MRTPRSGIEVAVCRPSKRLQVPVNPRANVLINEGAHIVSCNQRLGSPQAHPETKHEPNSVHNPPACLHPCRLSSAAALGWRLSQLQDVSVSNDGRHPFSRHHDHDLRISPNHIAVDLFHPVHKSSPLNYRLNQPLALQVRLEKQRLLAAVTLKKNHLLLLAF